MKARHKTISAYNAGQAAAYRKICTLLAAEIGRTLKNGESKIWHGAPVWFLDSNPIVGYSKQTRGVRLMFWSGADFEESSLEPGTGKFKDASIFYNSPEEIRVPALRRWLTKAETIQWDYKNIVKRKGKLVWLG